MAGQTLLEGIDSSSFEGKMYNNSKFSQQDVDAYLKYFQGHHTFFNSRTLNRYYEMVYTRVENGQNELKPLKQFLRTILIVRGVPVLVSKANSETVEKAKDDSKEFVSAVAEPGGIGQVQDSKITSTQPDYMIFSTLFSREPTAVWSGPTPSKYADINFQGTDAQTYTHTMLKATLGIAFNDEDLEVLRKYQDQISGKFSNSKAKQAFLNSLNRGDVAGAIQAMETGGLGEYAKTGFKEQMAGGSYEAFTGRSWTYFNAGVEFVMPIANAKRLYELIEGSPKKVSVALNILAGMFLTIQGHEARIKEKGKAEEMKTLISAILGVKGTLPFSMYVDGKEVLRFELGFTGSRLYMQKVGFKGDLSGIGKLSISYPVYNFRKGSLYVYGAAGTRKSLWGDLYKLWNVDARAGLRLDVGRSTIHVGPAFRYVFGPGLSEYGISAGAGYQFDNFAMYATLEKFNLTSAEEGWVFSINFRITPSTFEK